MTMFKLYPGLYIVKQCVRAFCMAIWELVYILRMDAGTNAGIYKQGFVAMT